MAERARRFVTLAGVVAVDLTLVATCWPHPLRVIAHLRHPHPWVAAVGADRAAAELARLGLFSAALWLLIGCVITAAAATPGPTGQVAAALSARALPRVLRAVVAGSLGATVAIIPLTAQAAPARSTAASVPQPSAVPGAASDRFGGLAASGPAIDVPWPRGSGPVGPAAGTSTGSPPDRARVDDDYAVRAGDSLWMIAARRLGGQASAASIGRSWPRWYRANTGVIGSDPDLIRPGQHLHAPTERGTTA